MKKHKGLLILMLLVLVMVIASCEQASNIKNSSDNQKIEQETPIVKVFDHGSVIQKDGSRLLITEYVEEGGNSFIDAYWFAVNEETEILDSNSQSAALENINIGTQVEIWHTGAVNESYPAQTTAAKIVVRDNSKEVPDGMISLSDAVHSALQSQNETIGIWAVKVVSLDTAQGYWKVELVQHEAMDQLISVKVNARTGQIAKVPVAENDAFRLFSPEPETEVGSSFQVEGEARVFEAAFSWVLEDGHTILAEGHEMAEAGAPAWGSFSFDVSYEQASQSNLMLILFVHSAKDGSVEHELIVPLKAPEELVNYSVE